MRIRKSKLAKQKSEDAEINTKSQEKPEVGEPLPPNLPRDLISENAAGIFPKGIFASVF